MTIGDLDCLISLVLGSICMHEFSAPIVEEGL